MPDTMKPAPLPSVFQLRVVLRGVSPLIWLRLLIPADTTPIAGLHAVLQIAFGWGGEHLHRFLIQRRVRHQHAGGVGFRDDPDGVHVAELGVRPTERFVYDYDSPTAGGSTCVWSRYWPPTPTRVYPRCTGGRRAGPPEGCGGVWAFLEQTQPHHVLNAAIRAAQILGMLLDDEGVPRFGEHRDELAGLLPLLGVDRFDPGDVGLHRRLPRRLGQLPRPPCRWLSAWTAATSTHPPNGPAGTAGSR